IHGQNDMRIGRTKNGEVQESPLKQQSSRNLQPSQVYQVYNDGWTLVVNGIHRRWPSVARLAASLEQDLDQEIGINLYLTPPQDQGFPAHMDGHDVFILQLSGHKRWMVFPPNVELPLEAYKSNIPVPDDQDCIVDAVIGPGHVLYIPRGFVHQAISQDDSSLHLTIGVHGYRWTDVVDEALSVAAEKDVEFRRYYSRVISSGKNNARTLQRLLQKLAKLDLVDETLRRMARRQVQRSHSVPDGHFAKLDMARNIDLDAMVVHRTGLLSQVHCNNEKTYLEFGQDCISAPLNMEKAFRFVSENSRFRIRELPDELTDESKQVLAKRLVCEGLLTLETN
ncbi:MAG: cupin domain-containing protein, partial [Gammaproteobacteria bacterium]